METDGLGHVPTRKAEAPGLSVLNAGELVTHTRWPQGTQAAFPGLIVKSP